MLVVAVLLEVRMLIQVLLEVLVVVIVTGKHYLKWMCRNTLRRK